MARDHNTDNELLSADQVAKHLDERRNGSQGAKQNTTLQVNHAQHADLMVRYISNLPIDPLIKKIMIMRIGSPLLKKKPLTHLAIGIGLGIPELQVKELEQLGIEMYGEMYGRSNGKGLEYNKSIVHDALNAVVSSKGGV